MSSIRGIVPLAYRRLARDELHMVAALDFDPEQVERFLGPIEDILAAVGRGPAHSMIAIEVDGAIIGFYVVHPSPRDASCWWLGWFALDRSQQGRGYGRAVMGAILNRLRHIDGCRRIRLLVAAENMPARRLYAQAGFRQVDTLAGTGELILELEVTANVPRATADPVIVSLAMVRSRRAGRSRRLRPAIGPHASRVIGVERGPPSRSVRGSRRYPTNCRIFATVASAAQSTAPSNRPRSRP
jgi:diamine N-acetyltransferase